MSLRRLRIGTFVALQRAQVQPGQNPYHPIATASLDTPVFDVVHMFSERSISAVPIIDDDGVVVNLYETVDVIVWLSRSQLCIAADRYARHWSDWGHTNPLILKSPRRSTNDHQIFQAW